MNNDKSAIQVIAGAARCPEYSPSMVKALMKKLETNEKAFALLKSWSKALPVRRRVFVNEQGLTHMSHPQAVWRSRARAPHTHGRSQLSAALHRHL